MEHAYWGRSYNDTEVASALAGTGAEEITDEKRLIERAAQDVIDGKVIGWFQGRFEWGPRSLGNRSILADPR